MKKRNIVIAVLLTFALFFASKAVVNADNMIYSGGDSLGNHTTMLYGGKFVHIRNSSASLGAVTGGLGGGYTIEAATDSATIKDALLGYSSTDSTKFPRSFTIKNALKYKNKYYDVKTTLNATRGDTFVYYHRTDINLASQLDVRKYADTTNKKVPLTNPNNASLGLVGNNICNCSQGAKEPSECTKILPVEIDLTIDIYEAGTSKHAIIPNLIVGLVDIDWGGGFYLPEGLSKNNAIILDKAGTQNTNISELSYNSSKKVVYSKLGPTNGNDVYEVANVYWKSESARNKGTFNITYGYRQAAGVYVDFGVLEGLPEKNYANDTPSGKDNAPVKSGDTIKYSVKYTNGNTTQSTKVVVTDTLSVGLTYVEGSSKIGNTKVTPVVTNNPDGSTKLVWTRDSVPAQTTEELTYEAKVEKGVSKVSNDAIVKIGDSEFKLDPLKNPVPSKEYAKDTPSGKDGAAVKKDDEIKYSIKYANVKPENTTIRITDVISNGIEYVKGSAEIGNKSIEPTVTKNPDGGYTLVWETTLDTGKSAELTYKVKVNGETDFVKNKASIKYGTDPEIALNELTNPLSEVPKEVPAPNTASPLQIAIIIVGSLILVSGIGLALRKFKVFPLKK